MRLANFWPGETRIKFLEKNCCIRTNQGLEFADQVTCVSSPYPSVSVFKKWKKIDYAILRHSVFKSIRICLIWVSERHRVSERREGCRDFSKHSEYRQRKRIFSTSNLNIADNQAIPRISAVHCFLCIARLYSQSHCEAIILCMPLLYRPRLRL